MSEGEEIKERVKMLVNKDPVPFWVKDMKRENFLLFKKFCWESTGGNYGQGIALLMQLAFNNDERFNELNQRIDVLEEKLSEKKDEKPKIKFLGSGGK